MSDPSKPAGGIGAAPAIIGGVAARHPQAELFPILLAPTTSKEKNTIREELIPVACWKINDVRFDFGSSFVLPESKPEFDELVKLRADHPGAPFSVFGHADPTGQDDFNKRLSDHRAESIYAILIRDAARWEKLYTSAGANEGWGTASIQHMLTALGESPGPVTGSTNAATKAAVRSFQGKNDLKDDGDPGAKTRAKLFAAYMTFLWPPKMEKTGFLGGGADAGGKADLQGCSEFNPVFVFSAARRRELDQPSRKAERDQENGVNRRVMILLFRPGTRIPASKWPCPRIGESLAGCKKRFFSDGEKRRSNQAVQREFKDTKDTFGCRFYHRFVVASPCEGVEPPPLLLQLLKVDDHFCPKQEKLDIVYTLKGLAGKPVKVQISSIHAKQNPIFERDLTDPEKTDGQHTIQWDGKGGAAAGELKDKFIHPLLSPYTVTLIHDATLKGSLDFKVLYHSIVLKNGPLTPDEQEPAKADAKDFVAFHLNKLGYYGGPVGKDVDGYLKKAIIRYKANHPQFREKFVTNYTDAITDALIAALEKKEGDRKFPAIRAIEDASKNDDLMVEALTYERTGPSADEFGTTRPPHEKDRLNRPLVPCEAEIFLKKKDDSKVLEPEAVGPARIAWHFQDANEDISPQFAPTAKEPSQTKEFIDKSLQLQSGRTGTNGDNCPQTFAGIRTTAANHKTPFLLGDSYVPYVAQDDSANKSVFSLASIDKDKFPKRFGRAGILFRPSFIAGDDYRFSAEIDFNSFPNKADLLKFHGIVDEKTKITAKTGIFTVRRFNNVALGVEWPKRGSAAAAAAIHKAEEYPEIAAEFKKAFNDVDISAIKSKKISEIITEAEYQQLVAANTKHKDKSKIKLLDDCMVGVDVPAQGNQDADDYKIFLSTFTGDEFVSKIQTPLGVVLSEKIRPTQPVGFIINSFLSHKPIDIRNDPANGDNTVTKDNRQFVNWSGSIGLPDSVILVDQMDPDFVSYVIAHEMGHNFYLLHWENTGETNLKNHDLSDHNCTMSYSDPEFAKAGHLKHQEPGKYKPHFCGKCNLALRGWDVTSANMAAKSKAKGAVPATPKPVIVSPVLKVDKKFVLVKHAHTKPTRRAVTLTADKAVFNGTGTFTRSSDSVKFFTDATGTTEVVFAANSLTLKAAELTGKGKTIFAEGFKPGEATLTLTLIKGGQDVTGPKTDKITAVKLTLDIGDLAQAALAAKKNTPGRAIHAQNKDKKRRRAKLFVTVEPAGINQTVVLKSTTNKVRILNKELPANNEVAVGEFPSGTIPATIFVEGLTPSAKSGDTQIQLGLKGFDADGDHVTVSVGSLTLKKVDDHFAPSVEKLDIKYNIIGLASRVVKLQVVADNYDKPICFEKVLTDAEKTDGDHTFNWDGKLTDGARKDRHATPLMAPYNVHLVDDEPVDEKLPFKILYHSVTLAFGKHTADEAMPAASGATLNKFVQAKLNELNYDAGPVTGTLDAVTVKAINRFQRANYKASKVLLTVNGTADADTVNVLKTAAKREVFESGKDPLTQDAKFYVYDNFMNDPTMNFVTGPTTEFNSTNRKTFAEDKMERPFLALEVEVKLLNKANAGVSAPDAVGAAPVAWEMSESPEDASVIPATNPKSQKYVKHAREIGLAATIAGAARIDKDGDNALDTFDGVRKAAPADTVKSVFPNDAGSKLEPYTIDRFDKETRGGKAFHQAIVKAWDDKTNFQKRKGRAGVYFRFSKIGGDNGKVRVGLNFATLTNQKLLEDSHKAVKVTLSAETGTWTVWRRTRFSAYCAMVAPTAVERPSGQPNWATVRDMFKQAFIEVENNGNPLQILNYASIITDAVYRATITNMPAGTHPPGFNPATPAASAAALIYSPTAIFGGTLPAQANGTSADNYHGILTGQTSPATFGFIPFWCNNVTNAILKVIHDKARETSPEGYVIFDFRLSNSITTAKDWNPTLNAGLGGFQAPANPFRANFKVAGRGYVRCAGAVTLNVDNNNEVNDYMVHEGGHARFLYHHAFVDEAPSLFTATSANPTLHDGDNLKCTMSYSTATDNGTTLIKHFCGKCLLRLRGWAITALPTKYS